MIRIVTLAAVAAMMGPLGGCGDSCDSIRAEMEEIGREIQKDPASAMDRAKELQELSVKAMEMKCGR